MGKLIVILDPADHEVAALENGTFDFAAHGYAQKCPEDQVFTAFSDPGVREIMGLDEKRTAISDGIVLLRKGKHLPLRYWSHSVPIVLSWDSERNALGMRLGKREEMPHRAAPRAITVPLTILLLWVVFDLAKSWRHSC